MKSESEKYPLCSGSLQKEKGINSKRSEKWKWKTSVRQRLLIKEKWNKFWLVLFQSGAKSESEKHQLCGYEWKEKLWLGLFQSGVKSESEKHPLCTGSEWKEKGINSD